MKDIKRILVPVDFSDNSKKIINAAQFLAEKCGAQMSAVFVVQSIEDYSGFFVPHMPMAQFEEEMVRAAEKKMESFLQDQPSTAAKVMLGDVAEQIIDYAAREKIDLIVMGTHGYKGLEKIMFGSVAEKVVKSAPCPVMTINPYTGLN
ncbi:MAG: universal stress protein [Deltaproteobacteria bacterium RIFOXYD12_FULL_57_12]|nr:MAG: universal stress protein [Deltaproteobacteria bacterium RIFOXYD12_FULL_57_12]